MPISSQGNSTRGSINEDEVRRFDATLQLPILRYQGKGTEEVFDYLVQELPVTIYSNGLEMVSLLCTPEYLDELALGFLVSEGFLENREELESVQVDREKAQVCVKIRRSHTSAEETFLKRYLTTGCGKGTSFSLDKLEEFKQVTGQLRLTPDQVLALVSDLQERSQLFKHTGAVHSSALALPEKIILYREDIGRHNAIDKILGWSFLQGEVLHSRIIVTSGRLSSEMVLKMARAGIPVVISRSAPTALAVKLAEKLGVTLVGFARGNRFNVYTHPERIYME